VRERVCSRCGKSENETSAGDDEPTSAVANPLYDLSGDYAHWDCMTLTEQRREDFQCERCGAQFHDDGRETDAGWITSFDEGPFLCPACQTPGEDASAVERFADTVETGKEIAASQGRDYPLDLEAVAEAEKARVAREDRGVEELDRRLND
jgi:hypothetical protein